MDLTTQLHSEQHAAKEVAQKMSNTEVELAELKDLVRFITILTTTINNTCTSVCE